MTAHPKLSETDAELMVGSIEDPFAFQRVYERHAKPIHDYFLRRSSDGDAALELTAETFAQAWRARASFREEISESAAPWLYGIARNVLLSSVRRGKLECRVAEQLGISERLDCASGIAATPEESWADGADELLDGLPASQREAVRLRVLDDLDYDQVGARLGTSAATARVRVHRGLAALRRRFAKTGITNPREENQ